MGDPFGPKTNVAAAKEVAQQFAKELSAVATVEDPPSGPDVPPVPSKTYEVATATWRTASQLPNDARNGFLYELGRAFGGVQTAVYYMGSGERKFKTPSEADLAQLKWSDRASRLYGKVFVPMNGAIVVPISVHKHYDGLEYVYTFQKFTEKSRTEYKENTTEVYVSAELGAKIPIYSVISLDLKAGGKATWKQGVRWDDKTMTRVGRSVSKKFVSKFLKRNCILFSRKEGSDLLPFRVQGGRLLERPLGGDPIGPFWQSVNSLGAFEGSGAVYIERALEDLAEETARQVAAGG